MSWAKSGRLLRLAVLAGFGALPGFRSMAVAPEKRPKLSPKLDSKVFSAWYWEVKELAAFLREQGLPSSGLKADLTQRVSEFLQKGRVTERRAAPGAIGLRDSAIPGGLKLNTPVKNYNNDAITRTFFEKHLDGFRFNEYLRGFAKGIPEGQKLTYGDLVEGWKEAEKKRSQGKQEIGKQFEYNQFTRDFFTANPGSSRKEMMDAWRTIRNCAGPNTYKEFARLKKGPRG
ncbi:unnamed protein product [Durusdinium trenchii]|uniref:SAP domain-containing protein n=3 Tax=Durusdinium trenchii TaxID=1381693 RepID=A0ABP0SJ24_9DINO